MTDREVSAKRLRPVLIQNDGDSGRVDCASVRLRMVSFEFDMARVGNEMLLSVWTGSAVARVWL